MTAGDYRRKLSVVSGKRGFLQSALEIVKRDLEATESSIIALAKARAFLQKTAADTQRGLRIHIQSVVQLALDAIFPGQYEFTVEFTLKRGQTEAELVLSDADGNRLEDPMDAAGGGVVDILAFALRLSLRSLSASDSVLVLDEPFRFLSLDKRPKAAEILRQLTKKLGLQVILVTHDPILVEAADKVFEVCKGADRRSTVLVI
jgi:DNA repair exonuclease SbcCD ATPase subunit